MVASSTAKRTAGREETAFLDLIRTVEALSRPVALLLKTEDLSPTQYNVLRILRGAKQGLTCGEIAERMISRDPDITRLLDRLEKREFVKRTRDGKDRRVVLTEITPQGLALLDELDRPMQQTQKRLLGHMSDDRLARLAELLAECRAALEEASIKQGETK